MLFTDIRLPLLGLKSYAPSVAVIGSLDNSLLRIRSMIKLDGVADNERDCPAHTKLQKQLHSTCAIVDTSTESVIAMASVDHPLLKTTFNGILHPHSTSKKSVYQFRGIKFAKLSERFHLAVLNESFAPETDATKHGYVFFSQV